MNISMGDRNRQRVCILPLPSAKDLTKDPFNPVNQLFVQTASVLVIAHIFYLLLKPLGQTAPVAQILAGMLLSDTLLSRIGAVKSFFSQNTSAGYYKFLLFILRIFFMFLIGLEVDFAYMKRNFRRACIIAVGGMAGCTILSLAFTWLMIDWLDVRNHKSMFSLIYVIVLSNSASPIIYRVIADMKLETSDIGRLAISSSLLGEMTLNMLYIVVFSFADHAIRDFFLIILFTVILVVVNRYLAPWFSTWYPNEKYMSKAQVLVFFVCILVLSTYIEGCEVSSAIPMFLLGAMFPREGKAYRTLLQLLRFPVHEFALPVYFGYIGFRFSLPQDSKSHAAHLEEYLAFGLTVLLSLIGKFIGVISACHFQRIPWNHSIFLSFILSMKGHFGLVLLDTNKDLQGPDLKTAHDLFVTAIVIVTLISGMIASFLHRKEERSFAHNATTLEYDNLDNELRALSCVYSPRQTLGAISLISALSGSQKAPFTPLLMHLVELPAKKKSKSKHREHRERVEFIDEDDYGKNDAVDINDSVDSFANESKILIGQTKVVSSCSNMYEDLCNGAEDLRVSIIFLPFHKHQRVDGKMKNDGEGIRATNQKVLRHSPCSVGIFMERGQTGFQQPHGCESVQEVATLFFGGPDDREALRLSKRILAHPQVHLTVVRFFTTALTEQKQIGQADHRNHEVLMSIPNDETETQNDNTLFEDFCNRYVSSGEVGYEEKHVDNGAQTLAILQEMGRVYSLFVVGKGRGDCPMTAGMSDWEECPELGLVGDLLACSEIDVNASVLIVQNHRRSNGNFLDD